MSAIPVGSMAKILIVDDDAEICGLVVDYLKRAAFEAMSVGDGAEMAQQLMSDDFDAIVLDLNLPDADGLDLCRRIRVNNDIPIIILTARGDPVDKVIGLEIGADDYLAKPFEPRELVARIRSVLRRYGKAPDPIVHHYTEYSFNQWRLSMDQRTLTDPQGKMIALSAAEYRLLRIFLDNPGGILSREKLLDLGAGASGAANDRAIDLQVSRLRTKLRCDGSAHSVIKTIRHEGYCLEAEVACQ